ncbi:MAG: hypothetical protein K2G40_06580, partial [Muribaculaceae bacterium]|nr:hypothetical protein [Muribaculaceae bacterium]
NVKSIDIANKKVTEFFTTNEFSSAESCPESCYIAGSSISSLGNDIIRDDAGNQYRIPTAGETMLLVPQRADFIGYGTVNNESAEIPVFNPTSDRQCNPNDFEEYVFLSNDANGYYPPKSQLASNHQSGFKGTTRLKTGKTANYYSYDDTYGRSKLVTDMDKYSYEVFSAYGLRFKGSDQYSAYKWSYVPVGNESNYISIKIKALSNDANIIIDDIVDNYSYWSKDYIEYKIPCIGFISIKNEFDPNTIYRWGSSAYFWTNTKYILEANRKVTFSSYLHSLSGSAQYGSNGLPIRLVKVKEPVEGTESAE